MVRTADGSEFVLTVIDEFDEEIARTRRNAKLMALLDERTKQIGVFVVTRLEITVVRQFP